MERKGFFTPEQEKLIADALDYLIKFKNPIVEKLDQPMFLILVRGVDNKILDGISPKWKELVIPVLDAALAKDYDKLRSGVVLAVNTPLGDDLEFLVYDTLVQFIITAVARYTDSKKENAA